MAGASTIGCCTRAWLPPVRSPLVELPLVGLLLALAACQLPVDRLGSSVRDQGILDLALLDEGSIDTLADGAPGRDHHGTCFDGSQGDDLHLTVPYHSQLAETAPPGNPSTACGPAALLMILDYFGLETRLSVVIEHLAAIPASEGGYDPACSATGNPVCTSAGALGRVAREQYDLQVEAGDNRTWEYVHRALCDGHPVITLVQPYPAASRGHFVTVVGMTATGATRWVIYHDPLRQAEMEAAWESFSSTWRGPVDLDDPLQPQGHAFWAMVARPP